MVVSTVICAPRHDEWLAQDSQYILAGHCCPKDAVEKAVRAAAFGKDTILRPGWLMHNYLLFITKYHWPDFESRHVMAVSYAPSTKLGHLSPGDVGKFASAALMNPEQFPGHKIELASENLTLEGLHGSSLLLP
jgi:uncharacterized protein YbjT (DUF2867 family)